MVLQDKSSESETECPCLGYFVCGSREDTHHYISSNINSVKTPHLCLRRAWGIAAEAFLLTGFCAAVTKCPDVLSFK